MKVLSYLLMILFSTAALFWLGDEHHIEWCMTMICALLAMLNAGVREKR